MGSPLFAVVLGAAIAQAAATTVVSTASEFDANMGQLDVVDVNRALVFKKLEGVAGRSLDAISAVRPL